MIKNIVLVLLVLLILVLIFKLSNKKEKYTQNQSGSARYTQLKCDEIRSISDPRFSECAQVCQQLGQSRFNRYPLCYLFQFISGTNSSNNNSNSSST